MRSAERFLRGFGNYTSDINLEHQLHLRPVRSPHAAANIQRIDVEDALATEGVVAVLTGQDYWADGWRAPKVDFDAHLKGKFRPKAGTEFRFSPNIFMPRDRIRYQGEVIAVVLAETASAAEDGVERVYVQYETTNAAVSLKQATTSDAPVIWNEAPDNVAARIEYGQADVVEEILRLADHRIYGSFEISRLVGNPIEPRAAIGEYRDGQFTLRTNTQMPNEAQRMLAEDVIGTSLSNIRVISPDVGGGFGARAPLYAEQAIVLWAAKRTGRPVKWTCTRTEGFLSDVHGRDWSTEAEIGLDKVGKILAYRVSTKANIGAYPGQKGPMAPFVFGPSVVSSMYHIPAIHMDIQAVYTNTVPLFPYRGAGAPETNYVLERMLDKAARKIGIDRAEIRLRNLITQAEMPYRSPVGVTYDSGDYDTVLRKALSASDWADFEHRRIAARREGKLRGIGLANFMKSAGGQPVEWGALTVRADGVVELRTGTKSHGQSHDVIFPRLVAQALGIDESNVVLIEGDTYEIKAGRGTHGSRSLMMASNIITLNCSKIVELGKSIGARLLGGTSEEMKYDAGLVTSRTTNSSVSLSEIAQTLAASPIDGVPSLSVETTFVNKQASYPSGTHVAEVEIDPRTGVTKIIRFNAIEDIGRVFDIDVALGQAHGGITQGIGQALLENCLYDDQSGQLVTGSFLDYGLPRALDVPSYEIGFHEVPSPTNPHGAKGLGENGPIGALPAIINAIGDALSPLGIGDIPMPATADKIWSLIRANLPMQT